MDKETQPTPEEIRHGLARAQTVPDEEGTIRQLTGSLQDLTDQRRLESQYQQLADIINRSQDFIGVADLESEALYVNPAGQAMVGLAGEAAVKQTRIEDYFFPEDLPFVRNQILPTVLNEGRWAGEFRFRHFQTGEPVHVLYDLFRTIDPESGQTSNFSTISRDISERKRSEQALRESEQRMQSVFRSAPVGIGVVVKRVFTQVNQRLCAMTGYQEAELVGQSSRMLYPSDEDYDFVGREKYVQIQSHGTGTVETHWRRKDGVIIDVLLSSTPIDLEDWGKEVTFTALDITARKQAEAALRESEARFSISFKSSPAPLVLSEIDTGLFLDVNDRWVEMLEFSADEQLGQTSQTVGIWEDPAERDRLVRKLRQEGQLRDEPIRFKTKTGRIIIALWSAEVINLSGKEAMLSMISDITQLRQSEAERTRLSEQLSQAQKMESIGRLAGGVAHDFNNMLSVILGHAELALGELPAEHPLRGDLEEIQKAAQRSADLTRQLLAFARKQTVAPRMLDLNETVAAMLKMLGRLIGEDIELLWHPGRSMKPVLVDPAQIDQLLANLCVNARDAIGRGVGRVIIETDMTLLNQDDGAQHAGFIPGEYAVLSVSDNGCGIDPETRPHIFEPFFTTKGIGAGTGLGLATAFGIVSQNKGLINVYSEPGRGSTFRIYLPAHPAGSSEPTPEPATAIPTARGCETVLLVEDEPAIQEITTMMLERLGYRVICAGRPSEALRLAGTHADEIDLLFTDVVMPEMNGRDLAHELLGKFPNQKALFMSGYTADVIAHQGVLDPGVRFIQKPFSIKDLACKIREVLDQP